MISSDELKNARKHLKLTQAEFGDRLGVTREYIGQIERGQVEISRSISDMVELMLIKEKKLLSYSAIGELLCQETTMPPTEAEGVKESGLEQNKILAELESLKLSLKLVEQQIVGLAETSLQTLNTNLLALEKVQGVSTKEVRDTLNRKDIIVLQE